MTPWLSPSSSEQIDIIDPANKNSVSIDKDFLQKLNWSDLLQAAIIARAITQEQGMTCTDTPELRRLIIDVIILKMQVLNVLGYDSKFALAD